MAEYFWPGVVCFIIVWILYAIIKGKFRDAALKRKQEEMLPLMEEHMKANQYYNIFLSHGKMLNRVKFIGLSPSADKNDLSLPFPLCEWLIVEKDTRKRAFIKPNSVRYYEEAE